MSPVSRGRKRKATKKSIRRSTPLAVIGMPDECDCPACSGEDFDPQSLLDELIAGGANLIRSEDPLDAEIAGAAFLGIGTAAGESFEEALVDGFIPQFEARATPEALAMLLAIGSVAQGRAGRAASAAADRLVGAGIARPGWAAELGEPVTVDGCLRLGDSQGSGSMLACTFRRARRSHAVVLSVDHLDCHAAGEILLLDADRLPEALEQMRADCRDSGLAVTEESLDAAEFRWQVERALDARAVHDSELLEPALNDLPDDEDGPGLVALAPLLRTRMAALPAPSRPKAPHGGVNEDQAGLTALQLLAQLAELGGRTPGRRGRFQLPGRRAAAALPAKRKKSDGPAPIYQIKVGLRGAKPPIWRRLEAPADISLARLHAVIQVAFDWDDSHLHVFETPYGSFGRPDAELGHRAADRVTLEQVAPAVNSKLSYLYDFGDNWEHEIVVEKVLDRDESVAYPRCTGGRRAAPPEDCGGVWGYEYLVEILSDPTNPEHEERLEWLGLDDATEFDPARFDAEAVTKALSVLR